MRQSRTAKGRHNATYDEDAVTCGLELRKHARQQDELGGGFRQVDLALLRRHVARLNVVVNEVRVAKSFPQLHEDVAVRTNAEP